MVEQTLLKGRKVIVEKLISYGFIPNDAFYEYRKPILDGEFQMQVIISEDGQIETKVMDTSVNEEFVLHLIPSSSGAFVGKVKQEYEGVLVSIKENCTEKDVFKSETSKQIIAYVRDKYGDELEFLWKNSDSAIWRRKDSDKWYGALLIISKRKLGLNSDDMVEIIDLHLEPENMSELIDGVRYFPGWHMNKKSWYTICLDGSVSVEEICERIDVSYRLATSKKRRKKD